MKNLKQTVRYIISMLIGTMSILTFTACQEDAIENNSTLHTTTANRVELNIRIPGMKKPASRTMTNNVDEEITRLDLYLFNEQGAFTDIVTANRKSSPDYTDGEYGTNEGTYTVTIPGNTQWIHFIANYTFADDTEAEGNPNNDLTRKEFIENNQGFNEERVVGKLISNKRIYWGRQSYEEIQANFPVTLYRNYAKIHYQVTDEPVNVESMEVLGWALFQEPVNATVAPFSTVFSEDGDDATSPFDFELETATPTLPPYAYRDIQSGTQEIVDNTETAGKEYYMFDYIDHQETYNEKSVYAIFKIKVKLKNEAATTTKYYKIALLEDKEKSENEVVTKRTTYDIVRNFEYTIKFKGIEPALGYDNFDEAVASIVPANNATIDIEKTVPEIVSDNYILRIENGTIRYYNDVTADKTINDILVYFGNVNGSGITDHLEVMWETELENATNLHITPCGNDSAGYFHISFDTPKFTDDQVGNHYLEGLIRVRETYDYLLSRFVRVYIGDPISFRPLLISSDIPALTGERLTIMFDIPDTTYLPATLYPIEIRFGSDRVDVEKNLDIDAMKVEFDNSTYYNVLQYTGESNGTYSWKADKEIENTWGYKYVYTIDRKPEAEDRRKRVTLRTTSSSTEDFSVLMEGMSTVTGTAIFNKRELEFKMQESTQNRIMISNGLPETRYATGHINAAKGTEEITVSYQLGTYDESTGIKTLAENASADIWVYYNPEELTPKTGITHSGYKDAEGNYFFVHQAKSAEGTLTFTPNGEIKNSVVFLTARSKNKYGEYLLNNNYYQMDANGEIKGYGNEDYLHTGVNDTAYRSAAVIINVMDEWEFNPAPSDTGNSGSYSYSNEIVVVPGEGSKLYLRINRPMGQEGVKLKFDTGGKFKLMESETSDYTIENDGTVTLASNTSSEYCYLTFEATGFNSACTIKMSSADGSSIHYEPAELTVVNSAISFLGFEFADEPLLAGNSITYNKDNGKLPPINGALLGIRVYLPEAMMSQGAFRFNLTSAKLRPVNNNSQLTTTSLANADLFNNYSVTQSSRNNTYTISVNENALQEDAQNETRCYLDILVESISNDVGTESIKFLGTNESNDDISFYTYYVNISTQDVTYAATAMHSLEDNNEFTSNSLEDEGVGDVIYYKVTLPDLGLERQNLPITLVHNGYLTLNDNSGYTDLTPNTDTLTVNANSTVNNTTDIVIPMKITQSFNVLDVSVTAGGDIVQLMNEPITLRLAKHFVFKTNPEDERGFVQYRLYGSSWNTVIGNDYVSNGDTIKNPPLRAEKDSWKSKDYNILKGSSMDIRVTIPQNPIVKYTDIALFNGSTQIAVASSEVTEDGKRYAVFSGITITGNMTLQFRNINTTGYTMTNSGQMIIKASTEKTWDFVALIGTGDITYSEERINVAGINCFIGTGNYEGMALHTKDGLWPYEKARGLYSSNGNRMLGILNLAEGTTVTIVASEKTYINTNELPPITLKDTGNAELVTETTSDGKITYTYRMTRDGILSFTLNRYYVIYTITANNP